MNAPTLIIPKVYDKCVFYDIGHGKRNHEGQYVTAPSKQWKHNGYNFHDIERKPNEESYFEEGVKNEVYAMEVIRKLVSKGVHVIPTSHNWIDTPLNDRVNIANTYHQTIQQGIFVSQHSNAANTRARGVSVWTSPGQTYSDILAAKYCEMFKSTFANDADFSRLKFMEDPSDGDPDYEARFTVLVRTVMPAVLIENLFFDNIHDTLTLANPNYINAYTDFEAEWIEWCVKQ
jgi:N-acetylmuramoyl-L-alanine amidase